MLVTVHAGSLSFDETMAGPKVRWKKPPTQRPNYAYRHRILQSFSSLQSKLALSDSLAYLCAAASSPHTHTPLIDAWVSPLFLSVSSLSVLPWNKSGPSRHRCGFSINAAPASKTHSNLVPFPRYQSNYPVLAIYIPRYTVRHQLVTEPPH